MKINKEMKDVKLEIMKYEFNYNAKDMPQIKFKLEISDNLYDYDPTYMTLSLADDKIGWTLSSLKYMSGFVIESLFDIHPETKGFKNLNGKIFKADIIKNGEYFNVKLPRETGKQLDINQLKEIDNSLKKKILEYAKDHQEDIAEETEEIDIKF